MTEGIQISPQGAEVGSLSVGNVVRKFIGKTAAPTVNDDITEGYIVSDEWIDETNDVAYKCLDNTDGAAVWVIDGSGDFTTLTDDSMADTLHRHSELSASDGTPNPALSVDTGGDVTLVEDLIIGDGKTIGQAAGPLLTFDDTNNYLEITGCNVGIGETGPETLLELTSTAPYITLHNNTHEDSDGGRESRLNFKGEEDTSGDESTLARIEVSHDGAAADEKGKLVISTNDGDDSNTPTAHFEIDAAGNTKVGDGGTTNYTKVEPDGTIEFNGAATVWKDANVGAAMLSRPAASQPTEAQFVDEAAANTGIYALGFAAGEKVSGTIEIPHDYKEGSDITFHVHWQGAAAPTDTDYVKWQLEYTVAQTGETLDAKTTISTTDASVTQYNFNTTSFAAITGTNFNIGDQFLFTLTRVAADGAAYAGVAITATVGFHYEVDTVGSRLITTK